MMNFTVDKENKQIHVEREFAAPLENVWAAWTQSELLDLWWAPKPYRTVTQHLDFRNGGYWFYAMVGPEGDKHWCRADYSNIRPLAGFCHLDAFCNEAGEISTDMPRTDWDTRFNRKEGATVVEITLTYPSLNDLEKIVEMGFREGFSMAMENLDFYFEEQIRLRREYKPNNRPRVSTYLNFPGNTEEAMLFYKEVFGGEFTGRGLVRFGETELPPENPPLSESDKRLILHAELTVLGGHVLMATDAPESMGFKLKQGDNMHINLEPATREEAERLFGALSAGGTVQMPLQDMFWGGCFGSFTDKFGINWMINQQDA